jgi:hypothetical protein
VKVCLLAPFVGHPAGTVLDHDKTSASQLIAAGRRSPRMLIRATRCFTRRRTAIEMFRVWFGAGVAAWPRWNVS